MQIPSRPLHFEPVYQTVVWGGRRLQAWRNDLPDGPIGESWEISQQARGMSRLPEGTSLAELMSADPAAVVGPGYTSNEFPLLIKILDASDRLSVQVHPDDALAQELGVGSRGKTECWFMLGDGGELFQGTTPGTDANTFRQAIEAGIVSECINRFITQDGDFFFMPARTLHALGSGCLLFEIQQSCDCTFRVYDWGRVGLDGAPRQLHIEESLRTIDFASAQAGPLPTPTSDHASGGTVRPLVDCAYFTVEERRSQTPTAGGDDSACSIIMIISGEAELQAGEGSCQIKAMRTYLVPAATGAWRLSPAGSQELRFLVARPRW